MQGVILAAGEGTRLKPLTNKKPKPLAEVGNKTVIEHNLDYAKESGLTDITIVIGYKRQDIKDHLGDSYKGMNINYVVQEESLGLAHATLQAKEMITDDVFALFLSDVLYEHPPTQEINKYMREKTPAVFLDTVPEEEAGDYGVCEIENGKVVDLVEKPDDPPSNKIIAGTYVLPKSIFEYSEQISPSDRGEYEITDAINMYLQETGDIEFHTITGERIDVAYIRDLFKARLLHQTGHTELKHVLSNP